MDWFTVNWCLAFEEAVAALGATVAAAPGASDASKAKVTRKRMKLKGIDAASAFFGVLLTRLLLGLCWNFRKHAF